MLSCCAVTVLCCTGDVYSRYVQNNFKDVERQAAIDMCLGKDAQQGTSSLCEMAWQQQQLEVCQAFPSVRQLGHRMLWPYRALLRRPARVSSLWLRVVRSSCCAVMVHSSGDIAVL